LKDFSSFSCLCTLSASSFEAWNFFSCPRNWPNSSLLSLTRVSRSWDLTAEMCRRLVAFFYDLELS
jgi:hypothetical protein